MNSSYSIPQLFRFSEWILLTLHFGMLLSVPSHNIWIWLSSYGILFLLSWLFPLHGSQWQRLSYVVLGLFTVLVAGAFDVDFELFLYVYIAKSYFLVGRRTAITLAGLTAIPWMLNEYARELRQFQVTATDSLSLNFVDPVHLSVFRLGIYATGSIFALMLSYVLTVQQKKEQQIRELSEEVESLAAMKEHMHIERKTHHSLGHVLTDLDIQLAVAQTLSSCNPTQAFQAVDIAKQLSQQCVENYEGTGIETEGSEK
jgi:signal transduction histidine kinase